MAAMTVSPADVRDLIRHDQDRRDRIARMQTLVTEALESGESGKSMRDLLEDARATIDAA